MGFFELILGNFSPASKIYSADILRIPGREFPRRVRIDIKGQPTYLAGEPLRDFLANLAQGGITKTSMDKKLRDLGLKDNQYERRREIMRTITKKKVEQKKDDQKKNEKQEPDQDQIDDYYDDIIKKINK